MECAGYVVGGVRHKLSAPDTDEQIKKFAFDLLAIRCRSGLRESSVRLTKGTYVARKIRNFGEEIGIRRSGKQGCQQCVAAKCPAVSL